MNMGIVLSFFNQRYFRDSLSTWCASSGAATCNKLPEGAAR